MVKLRAVNGKMKKTMKDKKLMIDYLQVSLMKMFKEYSRKPLDSYAGIIIYWK